MLKRTKIVKLLNAPATIDEVLVKGWVKTRRDSKDFSFVEVNDGSCLKNIQVIAKDNLDNYEEVKKLINFENVIDNTELYKELSEEDITAKVIEILDARIPRSSQNPDIQNITRNKKKIVLLNKSDLADDKQTKRLFVLVSDTAI